MQIENTTNWKNAKNGKEHWEWERMGKNAEIELNLAEELFNGRKMKMKGVSWWTVENENENEKEKEKGILYNVGVFILIFTFISWWTTVGEPFH